MSFILDALKKSETERQRQGSAEFATVPSSSAAPSPPRWLWVLVSLLLVNLVVLAGILLRDEPVTANPPASATVTAAEPVETLTPSFEARIADARSRQQVQAAPGPVAEVAPGTPEPKRADDRADYRADDRADDRANDAVTQAPTPRPSETTPVPLTLPTLSQLRAGGILSLPDLHLDIHVYSDTPADRFVFVNMSKHRENSRLASGPLIEQITPDGVVLDYQGTRFLLPRE